MFCDRCGAQMETPANFCSSCGRVFNPAAGLPPAFFGGRVARHVRTLGILWLIYAGLRVLESLAVTSFASYHWDFFDQSPFFVPHLIRTFTGIFLILAVAGAVAGWGLLERRPWARVLAIVVAVLALFKFPIGTALGIFTLWVLAPAQSEAEYRSMQRPV